LIKLLWKEFIQKLEALFQHLMEIFSLLILKIQIRKRLKDLILLQRVYQNHGMNRKKKEKGIVTGINFQNIEDTKATNKEEQMIL